MNVKSIYEDFKNGKITSEQANDLLFPDPDPKLELNIRQVMEMLEFIDIKRLRKIHEDVGIIKLYSALVLKGSAGSFECLEYIVNSFFIEHKYNIDITDLVRSFIEKDNIKAIKFLSEHYNGCFCDCDELLRTFLLKGEAKNVEILVSYFEFTIKPSKLKRIEDKNRFQTELQGTVSSIVGLLILQFIAQFICLFAMSKFQQ